ncbi:heptaprenyl diphosphate synthase component 1 [Chengkuizengella sediminis]|uniref:heptaprenyl diphosphate synthase component 1 n=1 Tax=Chengkuizengella sediminis TaxID=1885917 RepID=UPI00138A20DF|nr:heptaprenyl diphosphate synthase component 1 [Chengkuizengella sediminis]NDI34349.1 heptaprenyl diphosphate synthase component 1 [Chengkuizengella sediminis]
MDGYLVPELAKKSMQYDMIQKHTDLPTFPYSRSRLLYIFLNKHSTSDKISELYTLVTSLIQMGMDTHDLVDIGEEQIEMKKMRTRQLRVLAGDYFSSKFYHLLSQAGQIDTIHSLSHAISEVNRLKINLYMKMKKFKLTAEDYFQHCIDIKSQLYLIFSNYMDEVLRKQWPDILASITKCELITEEIDKLNQIKDLKGSWAYWYILKHATIEEMEMLKEDSCNKSLIQSVLLKYNIRAKLHQMLEKQWKDVSEKVNNIKNENIKNELEKIGQPFISYLSASKV